MKEKKNKINTKIFQKTEFSLTVIILALFLFLWLFTDSFMTEYNLTNLLKQASIIGIIATAATVVIISAGIDLSVGAITGMSALATAMLMGVLGWPTWITIICSILVGAVLGLYNGIIINEFKIAPFIATLGSMTIIRGLIKIISGAKTVVGVYEDFAAFGRETTFKIPNLAIVWISMAIITFFILKYTRFGRNIYVIGCGKEVAKLSGVNIRLNTYGIYAFAGLLCGVAGVMLTSRMNSAVPTGGAGYEMNAIAAAVIGGASLSGGKGSILGTLLGTILMVLIDNGGIQLGVNPFIMEISTGVLITVAVIIDQLRNSK